MKLAPSFRWKCASKTVTCTPSTFHRLASTMRGDMGQDNVASYWLFQYSVSPPLSPSVVSWESRLYPPRLAVALTCCACEPCASAQGGVGVGRWGSFSAEICTPVDLKWRKISYMCLRFCLPSSAGVRAPLPLKVANCMFAPGGSRCYRSL